MKKLGLGVMIVVGLALIAWCYLANRPEIAKLDDLIEVNAPTIDATIESPLVITGQARGPWFFEATFPVSLVNWDGLIIAEGYAEASGDWMTNDFVPFRAELVFVSPYAADNPDFMRRGALILQKSNPSDLPEHDAALEFSLFFAPRR